MDDYSHVTQFYLLEKYFWGVVVFKNVYAEIKKQFRISLDALRNDSEKEYFCSDIIEFMRQCDIIHQSCCPYTPTPQWDGIVGYMNKCFLEVSHALMFHRCVPIVFV